MTRLSPLLRDDLPADFDTSSVDEVFELYGAMGSRSGNTVLLRNRGTWHAFTRTSVFGPLKEVPLATGVAIELRQEGWKKELVITAADEKTHVFDVPMFDQERAQTCFAQPQSKPAVQLSISTPAPSAAARPAALDAPVFAVNSQSAEPDDAALTAEVIKLLPVSKIQAIKLYRERTGVGLKEAKDAVDAIDAKFPSPSVSVARRSVPGDGNQPVPSGSGTSSAVPIAVEVAMKKASSQAQKRRNKKHSHEQDKQVLGAPQENLEPPATQRSQAAPKSSFSFMLVIILSAFVLGILMAIGKC